MTLPMPPYTQRNLSADDNIDNHLTDQGQGRRTPQRSQTASSTASAPRNVGRVETGLTSKYPAADSFAERQIVHFAMVLGRKWACTEPGHEMCFTGQRKHVPLTDDMIMAWVTALCKGEATTSVPPFDFSEESGSDSDTQHQQQQLQAYQSGDDRVLTPSISASPGSMARLEMTSISTKPTVLPNDSSALLQTSNQHSNPSKTTKKYPSSPQVSAISSAASQISTISRLSSVSSSSWHSAATGMASLGSTAATSTSQNENVTPYASSSKGGSTVKISGPHSPDSEYSPSISSISSVSPSQRFPQPRLSLPQPLSPPPVSALPSPPGPRSSNLLSSARPDSPVHSLNTEFSDRLSISLHQLQQQQQEPSHHTHRQQYLGNPTSSSPHSDSPQSPLPPRPPRSQNRPHSPEITTRRLEQPRTPPHSSPPSQTTYTSPPHITPTSSGRSTSGLRLPFARAQTYPSPTTSTSPASSSQSHHINSPYLYPSQATQLMYVQEEEKDVLEPDNSNQRYDEGAAHGNADIEDEGEPEHIASSHADDHSFIHDQHPVRRGSDGRSDNASHIGVHDDSDQGSYVGSHGVHGNEGRSIWSPYTSFLPSIVTTPGGGNTQPPSVTSTVKIKWIESATLTKRAKNHLSKIKKWRKRAITVVVDGRYSKRGKEGAQVGNIERSAVIEMIGDGLEMARPCYQPRIHKLGYELGKEIQQWLQTFTDNDPAILYKKENISLLTTIQTCFLPILLMRLAELEPPAATLANNLIVSLTKVPLSLHENEIQPQPDSGAPLFTSPPAKNNRERPSSSGSRSLPSSIPLVPQHRTTSISSIAIHLVAQELGSGSPTCPSQHSWLGMSLLKIVEMSMKIRHISIGEMEDIRTVARKREGEYPRDGASFPALVDARFTRPWEVALFALCATADVPTASFFRGMVLGPMGIPVFMRSLDSLLSPKIDMDDVKWEDVGLTLRAIAFVSEQAWVVQGMSGSNGGKSDKVEAIVKAIMGVFWRDIPERWFSIRFWAMDAVRNITSHRPPLVRLLAEIKADQAFVTLTPTSSLYPSVINTTRMINEAGEKVRNKMLEEYRKESAKRAQEMVEYIRMFHSVGDGKMNDGKHVALQPVAIGFDGR